MTNLEALLGAALDKATTKLYRAKTIHLRYNLSLEHKEFLTRQAVLTIYACWEGFLKESLSLYLQSLNTKSLTYDELHPNYLAYQTDHICTFKSSKTNFTTISKLSHQIFHTYKNNVVFHTKINTESNANLKVTNSLLQKLLIPTISNDYEHDLNKLLLFRNSVAHGDDSITITQADINYFSILTQNLMSELVTSISEVDRQSIYRKL